jgi:choline dehydrogenase-like flavoprotein
VGDPGWGWDSLLSYFMKAETFTPPDEQIREKYGIEWDESVHGTNGPAIQHLCIRITVR